MQNDMTKGSPLRLIVFFTIPVLLGNIFQNVYNLMDSIIVGRFLGVNALAAVEPPERLPSWSLAGSRV